MFVSSVCTGFRSPQESKPSAVRKPKVGSHSIPVAAAVKDSRSNILMDDVQNAMQLETTEEMQNAYVFAFNTSSSVRGGLLMTFFVFVRTHLFVLPFFSFRAFSFRISKS